MEPNLLEIPMLFTNLVLTNKNGRGTERHLPKIDETNKTGRGTERHLPKTDESIVWPAGERR